MHYVRLLRPPFLSFKQGKRHLNLVFTITTDLGESFLSLLQPLNLVACLFLSAKDASPDVIPAFKFTLRWTPGMRVLKTSLQLPAIEPRLLSIGPLESKLSASEMKHISAFGSVDGVSNQGLILPAWANVAPTNGVPTDISFRRLHVADGVSLDIEEEIGESIARHIWDAGLSALPFVSTMQQPPMENIRKANNGTNMHLHPLRDVLHGSGPVNILELGCGVGILGIGLAAILSHGRDMTAHTCRQLTVLMTDLPEAEGRARSNIEGFRKTRMESSDSVGLFYENLDWEDGRLGAFGPQVRAKPWDLIVLSDCTYNVDMLPALVETLTQVHTGSNTSRGRGRGRFGTGEPYATTRVLLATKRRHSSEDALLGVMADQGWLVRDHDAIPMPVLGADTQRVDLYLFEHT